MAERRGRLDLADWADLQREQFLQAVAITFDAVSLHIERYAALARELAQQEPRPERRCELETIALNCAHIAHRPRDLLAGAAALLLHPTHPADRVQWPLGVVWPDGPVPLPWYRREVELSESLPRTRAIELLQGCWLKLLEVNKIRSGTHSKASAGSPLYQNVTIGGQNWRDGKAHDAVNGLSYAILESCGQLRSTQPNLSVRYHARMSEDFLDACIQVIRCGFGMPAFNNDEVVIPGSSSSG